MYGVMKQALHLFFIMNLCFNKTHASTYTIVDNDSYSDTIPLVVLHGLESSSSKIEPFCYWLSVNFDVSIFNLEIGNGEKTSLYTPLNEQLDDLCDTIYSIDELKYGFNFIGISQGGLLARGYVERCNIYPVINLITLVSPHGGEYIEDFALNLYSDFFQEHFSVASYWRDPNDLYNYYNRCSYLPTLNNEINNSLSQRQKDNINTLEHFVMVWSPLDTVLRPPESGKFSFYDENLNVVPLEEMDFYKYDSLGLRMLNETDRLHTYETNCSHVDHRNPVCYSQLFFILKNYLL